jgi:hypothetical protein
MKYLAPHVFNDAAALNALAMSKARIAKILNAGARTHLVNAYAGYAAFVANPPAALSKFKGRTISSALLIEAYETPPVAISPLIIAVQTGLSPNICPMCGSLKTGTADHYFPKADYPEFSFYSWNLVPACDCNIKRGTALYGTGANEWIIHPFYEKKLTDRIISLNFDFSKPTPTLAIGKLYPAGINPATIDFHVEKIHSKTTMLDWLIAEWARLLETPMDAMTWYPTGVVNKAQVTSRISELMTASDRKLGTPNNWTSALFHGVHSSPQALDLVTSAMNSAIAHPGP